MERHDEIVQVAMVDDEEPLCLGVRRILEKYTVHIADVSVDTSYGFTYFTTGEDLLAAVKAGARFDLLLLDLKLPGINGLDVLTSLSQDGHEVLTIMITAYATFETAVQATKLGAYDFLPKPFSPDELRYAVRKATSQLVLSRAARKLAEEKRQVRFNFISVLAHELKAPLNAIEGYLNILRTEEDGQHVQMIDRSLLRLEGMKKLIFDLLDLTRIESGQKQRTFVHMDIRDLAKAAIDLLTIEARARSVSMELRAPDPVPLLADPSEIEIIFNNLVSNAVKYNKDGGSVTVAVLPATDGRPVDHLRRRHRHRAHARRGGQALQRVRAHQERGHGEGAGQRPRAQHRAQAGPALRRRRHRAEREARRQHLHRDAHRRAAGASSGRAGRRSLCVGSRRLSPVPADRSRPATPIIALRAGDCSRWQL